MPSIVHKVETYDLRSFRTGLQLHLESHTSPSYSWIDISDYTSVPYSTTRMQGRSYAAHHIYRYANMTNRADGFTSSPPSPFLSTQYCKIIIWHHRKPHVSSATSCVYSWQNWCVMLAKLIIELIRLKSKARDSLCRGFNSVVLFVFGVTSGC